MPLLEIRTLGDPVLRSKTRPVEKITDKTRRLINNMVVTMKNAEGLGLAAPQVGVLQKIIVVLVDDSLYKLVNPEIVSREGREIDEEGCLSIPGRSGPVSRAAKIVIKAQNEEGKNVKITADGLLARAFQHEVDHLHGELFIDKLVDLDKFNPEV